MDSQMAAQQVQVWNIDRLVFYARNPRKNDAVVDRMCSSIREFGFKIPVLARSDGEVVDGHLRLKAARKLGITDVPVILCDEWTKQQVKAFRLIVNRSVTWADWDEELLALELQELNAADFDLSLTGFDPKEIDDLLVPPADDEAANAIPPVPENPASRPGDLWLCGKHRVLCGNSTSADDIAKLLGDRKPLLMVTDPPYGIELDSEWRDRAGLNGCGPAEASYMKQRTAGHTATTISGDTRADWSEAFELVPSLQIAYVWHASTFTREVLNGLLREEKERALVREGRRELDNLGFALAQVHHGRQRRGEVRPSHAEAGRFDAAPDPKPHKARRVGLRTLLGIGYDPGRG
jgi:ParB-like chromosome segregation protein Spo0J